MEVQKLHLKIFLVTLLGWAVLMISGCSWSVGDAEFTTSLTIKTPELKMAGYRKDENNGDAYLSRQAEQPIFTFGHKNALATLKQGN